MSKSAVLPDSAGGGLRLLRRAVSRLPRGRARIARVLSRVLRKPFVDVVEPSDLDVRLVIDPADPFQLEIWLGAYQPHVVDFLRCSVRPGDRVLCAGLHVGYVASLARRLAGRSGFVLSAEPDPLARAWAERNLSLGDGPGSAPVMVFAGGLGGTQSELLLYESRVMGHSSFAAPHQGEKELVVPVCRGDDWLDSIGVKSLDVLVLDIEGWEVQALRGLTRTLDNSPRLRALVEVSDWALNDAGTSPDELLGFLRERGFTLRWAETSGRNFEHGVWGDLAVDGSQRAGDLLCYRIR